ncbi:uncharacterized protein [Cicer arietinum]|uniref:Uncharacterized protein LOC101503885 n=1 Tax=Cicer arietinum TaxID=3827 RepID=A0A1S2XDC6_CICAR|nr:uncharacterized protein LOC101503885 [Cicer arietinum]
MSAEQVLKSYDISWFETSIFTNKKTSSPSIHSTTLVLDSTSNSKVMEVLFSDTKLLRIPTLHVRSFSDENLSSKIGAFSDSLSPNSVLTHQKLKTILSGKVVEDFTIENTHAKEDEEKEAFDTKKVSHHTQKTKLRKGKSTSRSLSELEFKELKGFMDLGFVFAEEDKDSRLVSLIPGLQQLGKDDSSLNKKEHKIDENVICRPYLSEAWGLIEQTKEFNPLLNWRVPILGNEIDMKDNLKFWAHTVASIVR